MGPLLRIFLAIVYSLCVAIATPDSNIEGVLFGYESSITSITNENDCFKRP